MSRDNSFKTILHVEIDMLKDQIEDLKLKNLELKHELQVSLKEQVILLELIKEFKNVDI